MRIAMISYHTCPLATLGGKDTGGMNVYVRDLTRTLGKLGVHVDVFTRSQDEHVPHILHDLGYGNRIVHIPAGLEVPLPKTELFRRIDDFVNGVMEFARVKNLKYDLIHSHYWMSGIAGIALKEKWNVPMVHMFHTLGIMKQRVAQDNSEVESDYRLAGEYRVLSNADRILVSTPAEMAQLQWLYHADTEKILIIPPGVDLSRFYPIARDEAKEFIGVPPCNRMILFVGRIEPLKGVDVLIQAISLMYQGDQANKPSFCLAVIGGNPETSETTINMEMARLQALREQFGLHDLVVFLGLRSQDTLPYYYSAAEVVVVPSHYESFGMVALEAMACGTPVVASEVGGLAYLVQDGVTGYTIPVGDPKILADRLNQLLNDNELSKKMGEQGASLAINYGWERIAAKIYDLYEKLIIDYAAAKN
jgi:D-inositol-3-phosphate glycosyltransferase